MKIGVLGNANSSTSVESVEHSSSSRPVKKTKKAVCEEKAPFHFT